MMSQLVRNDKKKKTKRRRSKNKKMQQCKLENTERQCNEQ
jgi:hypothetical protein